MGHTNGMSEVISNRSCEEDSWKIFTPCPYSHLAADRNGPDLSSKFVNTLILFRNRRKMISSQHALLNGHDLIKLSASLGTTLTINCNHYCF
jgi:hypothetical protein